MWTWQAIAVDLNFLLEFMHIFWKKCFSRSCDWVRSPVGDFIQPNLCLNMNRFGRMIFVSWRIFWATNQIFWFWLVRAYPRNLVGFDWILQSSPSNRFIPKGIPDYRSEGVGLYARSTSRPVQYNEFLRSPDIRKRYWARNFVGWPRFSNCQSNSTHIALSRFERDGRLSGIVTQNVDRLHSKAGSQNVVEVHGSAYDVMCLGCDYTILRHDFQDILNSLNRNMIDRSEMVRPDGDVEISQVSSLASSKWTLKLIDPTLQEYIDSFQIPPCPDCGGILKPNIVFFGDNVPRDRANKIAQLVCSSDGLLVLGSSLLVYSGYRLVLHTFDLGLPIAIVNIGATRGDQKANLKISAKCGDIIPKLFS